MADNVFVTTSCAHAPMGNTLQILSRKSRKQAQTSTIGKTLLRKEILAPLSLRIYGRRTRTLLPATSYLLMLKVQEDLKEKVIRQKSRQTKYCNRNTMELPPLQKGEVVRVALNHLTVSGNTSSHEWRTKSRFVRTKLEKKMVDCAVETVDTSASLRNHLVRLLKPIQLHHPRTTSPTHLLPQLHQ